MLATVELLKVKLDNRVINLLEKFIEGIKGVDDEE